MNSSSKRVLSRPAIGTVAAPLGRSAANAPLQLEANPQVVVRPVQPKLTEERLMEMERKAYEAGYAAGQTAGYEVGEAAAQRVLAALKTTQTELTQVRAQLLVDAEREVANLAVAVAGMVLGHEIDAGHPVVLAGIAAAAQHFSPSDHLTLRLHPEDRALLANHQEALMATLANDFDMVSDPQIVPGGTVVEGGGKLIDATLTTRFEQLVQQTLGDA